jgi:hypothetical protein
MEDVNYNLVKESTIKELFPSNDMKQGESVMSINKGKKFGRKGYAIPRTIIMSTHGVYLLEDKSDILKSKFYFHELVAIIKALQSNQFVLKFDTKNDVRMVTLERDDMIFFIINRFANRCPDLSLKVYGIP